MVSGTGASWRRPGAWPRHVVLPVDLSQFGSSALTDSIQVPKDRAVDEMERQIPVTYVPARNTVLLSLALAWAESLGAADIFIGANAVDYSGYPDCRPEYIAAFQQLANLATKAGVEGRLEFKVHAPLVALSKAQIIRRGTELGVDYGLTHSCYDPADDGRSCARCDACLLRLKGFAEAGLEDPLPYQGLRIGDQRSGIRDQGSGIWGPGKLGSRSCVAPHWPPLLPAAYCLLPTACCLLPCESPRYSNPFRAKAC